MRKIWMLLTLVLIASGIAVAQDQAPPDPPDPPQAAQPAEPPGPPAAAPMPMQRGYRGGPGMPGPGMRVRTSRPGMGLRGLGPGKWWKNPELAQKIGLTDDQIAKMEKIFQDSRLKLIDLHATLEKQEAILDPLVEADRPDEDRVLAQIDQVAQARAELEKANARMLLGIRNVLTPEQWKQLKEERAASRMRRREARPMRQRMRLHRPPAAPAPPPPTNPDSQEQ